MANVVCVDHVSLARRSLPRPLATAEVLWGTEQWCCDFTLPKYSHERVNGASGWHVLGVGYIKILTFLSHYRAKTCPKCREY